MSRAFSPVRLNAFARNLPGGDRIFSHQNAYPAHLVSTIFRPRSLSLLHFGVRNIGVETGGKVGLVQKKLLTVGIAAAEKQGRGSTFWPSLTQNKRRCPASADWNSWYYEFRCFLRSASDGSSLGQFRQPGGAARERLAGGGLYQRQKIIIKNGLAPPPAIPPAYCLFARLTRGRNRSS